MLVRSVSLVRSVKLQIELERLAREGGKELRDRGERELIVELR